MMAPQGTIEGRLIRRLTMVLAATFLLFALVYALLIQNDAHFHAAEEVGELARDLAGTIERVDGREIFDQGKVTRLSDWPVGAGFAAINLSTRQPVGGSAPDLLAALRSRADDGFSATDVRAGQDAMRVTAIERVDLPGARYQIAVSRPATRRGIMFTGLRHEFLEEFIPGILPVLMLAVLVAWATIRMNLRPLRRASDEARAVSADHPGQRLSTTDMADEIRPLVDAVNWALGRLESALAAQKRFTANAAHELRTPLAVLRARIDSLPPSEARVALGRDTDRLSRSVSQMLATARLQSQQVGATGAVDLERLVRDVLADLAPLAQARGRDLVLEGNGPVIVQGWAEPLEGAVRNLVENALRFTPVGTNVTVRVRPDQLHMGGVIEVEDCGPGVAPADRGQIFEPFWRASDQHGEGAGLGLAIVREVAALHGGQISAEDAPGGGARFVLRLASSDAVGLPVGAGAPHPSVAEALRRAMPAGLAQSPANLHAAAE